MPKFCGFVNLELGMLSVLGMAPIGIGLQEPVVICCPLVIGASTVRQKLMKLFVVVRDGDCPVTGGLWPSLAKPGPITRGSSVRDV